MLIQTKLLFDGDGWTHWFNGLLFGFKFTLRHNLLIEYFMGYYLIHNTLLLIQRCNDFLDSALREYTKVRNIGDEIDQQIFLY